MHLGILSLPDNPHCRKWAQALARAGARVTVFSFEGGELPGAEVCTLTPPLQIGGRYRYPAYWLARQQLATALRHRGVEVLHPLHLTPFGSWGLWSGFRPLVPAAMGADVLEYPRVLGWRDPRLSLAWRQSEAPRTQWMPGQWLRNRYYRAQVQAVVRAAAGITADNQPLLDALQAEFDVPAAKLRLLRWGVDTEAVDAQTPEEAATLRHALGLPDTLASVPWVLSARGLRPIYQPEALLRGLEAWLQAHPEREVRIVVLGGPYDVGQDLQAAHRALAAADRRFVFIDKVLDAAQMTALLARTTVYLQAPLYDGYSATLAEARYAGALLLVNDIPAHRELLYDYRQPPMPGLCPACIVPDLGAETLAQGLEALLQLPAAERLRWTAAHRAWIDRHSRLQTAEEDFLAWVPTLGRPR